jgi:hypothetical protein
VCVFLDRNIRFRASQEDFWQKVSEKVSLKHKEQPQTKKNIFPQSFNNYHAAHLQK